MPSLLIAQNHTALMTSLLCCLHGPACARLCSFQRTAGCFASHVQGVTTPASTSHTVAGRSRLLLRHHISQVQARGASSDAAAAAAVHNQPGPAADARRRAASASARRPTRQPPPFAGPQPRRRGRPPAPPRPRAGPTRARRRAWRCRGGRRTQTGRRPARPAGAGRWAAPARADAAGGRPGAAGLRARRQRAGCCCPTARCGAGRMQARAAHARRGGRRRGEYQQVPHRTHCAGARAQEMGQAGSAG